MLSPVSGDDLSYKVTKGWHLLLVSVLSLTYLRIVRDLILTYSRLGEEREKDCSAGKPLTETRHRHHDVPLTYWGPDHQEVTTQALTEETPSLSW